MTHNGSKDYQTPNLKDK